MKIIILTCTIFTCKYIHIFNSKFFQSHGISSCGYNYQASQLLLLRERMYDLQIFILTINFH